jgi:hypothetical protein
MLNKMQYLFDPKKDLIRANVIFQVDNDYSTLRLYACVDMRKFRNDIKNALKNQTPYVLVNVLIPTKHMVFFFQSVICSQIG